METGLYEIQIFLTVVAAVSAVFAVMSCMSLRQSNQQLRRLTVQLRLRRQLEQKEALRMPGGPVARTGASALVPGESTPEALAIRAEPARVPPSKRDWNALLVLQARPKPGVAPAPIDGTAGASAQATKIQILPRDWSEGARQPTPISPPASVVPAGFHDSFVLCQLIQTRQPVSGLVVSIGVNAPRPLGGTEIAPQVGELIRSLIGAEDFGCLSGSGEFLLIFPREQGASAQRVLRSIAQRLWDFQLRWPGKNQILFSWGAIEACGESIVESIASATERMHETKRARQRMVLEAPRQRVV